MPEVKPLAPWYIHIFHLNFLGRRFDYKQSWIGRRGKIANKINAIKPDVITAVECQLPEAKEIARLTGYHYVNYLGSTIFYRSGLSVRVLKKYSWLKNYPHSAIVVEVANKYGQKVNVAASHLPPFTYRASLRERQQKDLCALFAGWSDATIICTDANWSKTFEAFIEAKGWKSSRKTAKQKFMANFKTSSKLRSTLFRAGNPIDYVITKSGLKNPAASLYYKVIDGRDLSDHNGLEVVVRCGKPLPVPPIPTNLEG